MKRKVGRLFFAMLVAAVVVAVNGAAFAQKMSGAIFTTDANSNFVNGNVYEDMNGVYLNGGPRPNAPCTAAGLPGGEYYFQVTDPSGRELLSLGSQEIRRVLVKDGVIVAASFNRTFGDEFGPGIGIGKCQGSITVRLYPFDVTPNPGGEYKVWMTPVGDYDLTLNPIYHGFIPSKSKTDNFKVMAPVDSDGDLIPDSEESPDCVNNPDLSCGVG